MTEIVSIFLGVTHRKQKALMEPLELSEGQVSRKMNKGAWSVDDIDVLAQFFGVTVSDFFEDPEVIRQRMLGISRLPCTTTPGQTSLDDLLLTAA